MRNIILMVAGVWLFILGLFMTVDIGGIDILICPRCGSLVNMFIGILTMAIAAATVAMAARTKTVAM
jgi:hypothetical protein